MYKSFFKRFFDLEYEFVQQFDEEIFFALNSKREFQTKMKEKILYVDYKNYHNYSKIKEYEMKKDK